MKFVLEEASSWARSVCADMDDEQEALARSLWKEAGLNTNIPESLSLGNPPIVFFQVTLRLCTVQNKYNTTLRMCQPIAVHPFSAAGTQNSWGGNGVG